jgi:hypothetical protein
VVNDGYVTFGWEQYRIFLGGRVLTQARRLDSPSLADLVERPVSINVSQNVQVLDIMLVSLGGFKPIN